MGTYCPGLTGSIWLKECAIVVCLKHQLQHGRNMHIFVPCVLWQMHIMKYLKVGSLVQLSAVNKDFHGVARQPILWRRLYIRDFGRKLLAATFCTIRLFAVVSGIGFDNKAVVDIRLCPLHSLLTLHTMTTTTTATPV